MQHTARLRLAEPIARYGAAPAGRPVLLAWSRPELRLVEPGPGASVLGSGPACEHRLSDGFVSRTHARLSLDGGRLAIQDLGSTNGTFVNGRRVEQATLAAGSRVTVGRTELIVLSAHEAGDGPHWEVGGWVGAGASGLDTIRRVLVAAHLDVPVLVSGPTGAGKEVLAALMHRLGPRPEAPFLAVNCATLEPGTADAELFGHASGAFTDGKRDRPGLFVAAGEGTLFLDEVAEARPEIQAKLLRVLERREVRRLGEDAARPVRCRVIAASLADFEARVRLGTFREDLFHRLAAYELPIAPLASRPADVAAIARHAARREGFRLSSEAEEILRRQPWSGNARELLHVLTRARIQAHGDLVERADIEAALGGRRTPLVQAGEPGFQALLDAAVVEQGSLRRALASLGVPRSSYYDLRKREQGSAAA